MGVENLAGENFFHWWRKLWRKLVGLAENHDIWWHYDGRDNNKFKKNVDEGKNQTGWIFGIYKKKLEIFYSREN